MGRGQWRAILAGALALCFACAAPSAQRATSPAASPVVLAEGQLAAVAGRVVDQDGRPLPDQIVVAGAERTTSDGEGRFFFLAVPATYDLVVASPTGEVATVYQGLSRRDPRVKHAGARVRPHAHRAQIVGTVTSAPPARGRAQVWFSSPRSRVIDVPRPLFDAARPGRYGPLTVVWDGSDTIAGRVMVLLQQEGTSSALFTDRPLTLRDGEIATVDLTPVPAPVVQRPFPEIVKAPKTTGPTTGPTAGPTPNQLEAYELPGSGWVFRGDRSSKEVVDLRAAGIELCAMAFQWDPELRSQRSACGFAPEKQVTITLMRPVAFTAPAVGTLATPGMTFSWTAAPGAIYRLRLGPVAADPTARHPRIDVFTRRTTTAWPDLSLAGVVFPTPQVGYAATIATRGPLASIDDLTADVPTPLGPREVWQAESQDLTVLTVSVQAPSLPAE